MYPSGSGPRDPSTRVDTSLSTLLFGGPGWSHVTYHTVTEFTLLTGLRVSFSQEKGDDVWS